MWNECKLLDVFIDVVEQGSFSRAAKLRKTDPAHLSRQIRKLENALKSPLLIRSTRGQTLTAVGKEVYKKANEIKLLLLEINEQASGQHKIPGGRLTVTAPVFYGRNTVDQVISELKSDYPQASIRLDLSDEHTDLSRSDFDFAVRFCSPDEALPQYRKLRVVGQKVVASPGFISRYGNPLSVDQLMALPSVIYSSNTQIRDRFHYISEEGMHLSRKLNFSYETNDIELVLRAVLRGQGYAVLCDCMVDEKIEQDELIQLLPEVDLPDAGGYYLIRLNGSDNELMDAFSDKIFRALKQT